MNALESSNPVIVVPICPCQSPSHPVLDENGSLSSPTFALCVGVDFAWTRVRTVSPQVSIESLAKRTQQVYQSKTCWSWLRRSLVQRHWCRSLPRVRGNPSSFDVPEQSTDQSLEPFHQRWASLVADTTGLRTDGRCRRLLFGVSVGRLFLSYSSHDGQQFFRRCRLKQPVVQIGFCHSRHVCFQDVGVAWTKHHKPDFSRDRPGRHGTAGFSFCKFLM